MHGRLKVRTTEEQQEIKRIEREKKLKLYRAGMAKVFEKRKNGEFDEEALGITAQLLSANPDIYTLWNFRREIMLDFKEKSSTEDFQASMSRELQLTQQCLKVNPKSYGGWSHRVWVLEHMPKPDLAQELAMCNKYLELDERNFHVWDHRRVVVEKDAVSPASELAYSTSKIASNFSNYSSWHYRSQLLPLVYPDPLGKRPIREDEHMQELELVQNACFTDPSDSSAWFYQRWLLGRAQSALALASVSVAAGAALVALATPTDMRSRAAVSVDGGLVPGTWQPVSRYGDNRLWNFLPAEALATDEELKIEVAGDSATVLLANGEARWSRKPQFGAQLSEGLKTAFEHELDNCLQLLELEPDSKWTMISTVLLMQAIDRNKYKDATMEKLRELLKIDPLRSEYYKDLRSKFLMEYAIDAMEELSTDKLDLSGAELTALYHTERLCNVRAANLSGNRLSRALHALAGLQSCTTLDLSDNGIGNLAEMPALPNLRSLDLSCNAIRRADDLQSAARCPRLEKLQLDGNPFQEEYDLPVERRKLAALEGAPAAV